MTRAPRLFVAFRKWRRPGADVARLPAFRSAPCGLHWALAELNHNPSALEETNAVVMTIDELEQFLAAEFPQLFNVESGLAIEAVWKDGCRVRQAFREASIRPGGTISAVHGEEELAATLEAFRSSLRDLRREGALAGVS